MLASTSSSLASASPSSSSTLQEGNGIRKSGPIQLLSGGSGSAKKKGQAAYAVLSERALELYDSEKAHRKKKAHRCIVDLSKCFNVSQQNCPRTRAACVCLLMPDECFLFRGDSQNETAEWFCTLLSTVISARALNLGRPVFANEFFECVWDVTVCPQQPKLKRPPAPAANAAEFANSQNLCSIMHDLAGRKRLCFYPHTIILCKFGIEPARSGLPKSGIPPFQPIDFVEFSRHYIAQFGAVDKYFLMRIGRSSPMGSCEVWVQCESEEAAAEISRKLQEIIQRETEKRDKALTAIRGQQQQQHNGSNRHGNTGGGGQQQAQIGGEQCFFPACSPNSGSSYAHYSPGPGSSNHHQQQVPQSSTPSNGSASLASTTACRQLGIEKSESLASEPLEPISEDEQLDIGGGANSSNQPTPPVTGRKKHSSLSQSAREKRLELRECKAKVDSLEEEEQRFQQRQLMMAQRQQQQQHGSYGTAKRYAPMGNSSSNNHPTADVCRTAPYGGPSITSTAAFLSRPNTLLNQITGVGYQLRRRGSGGTMAAEIGARSKSLSLEEQQAQSLRPFAAAGIAGRLWTMDKADSLLLLGGGYGPPDAEETEDSGGTLRLMPCEGQEGSQAPSRSSSSLNLAPIGGSTTAFCPSHSNSVGQLVETYVEFHAAASDDKDEDEDQSCCSSGDESTTSDEEEAAAVHDGKEAKAARKGGKPKSAAKAATLAGKDGANQPQQQRRQRQPLGGSDSLDTGAEADQSCSCSSSVASSTAGGHDDTEANKLVAGPVGIGRRSAATNHPGKQQQREEEIAANNNQSEYTLMDKVSCSSDSFSHLAVPHPWDRQNTGCPEEICSYTSDSGDSCYSSMINGHLNPRAFSFSSTSDLGGAARAARHHFGVAGTGGRLGSTGSGQQHQQQQQQQQYQQQQQHPAAAKWTAAAMGGGRNHHLHQQQTTGGHFSPQKSSHGPPQQLESSSSSRFSMETSLITPMEEDERQVTFADEEQRDRLGESLTPSARGHHHHNHEAAAAAGDEMLRKRAFSLGSKSWLTKPFRKLSTTVGTPRQQRNSCGTSGGGGPSRSGSSSLVGSVHADLSAAGHDQSSSGHLCSSSSHRLGSSSSFASSSAAANPAGAAGAIGGNIGGHHTRSDSVGSSHSAAISLPGQRISHGHHQSHGHQQQQQHRKKLASEERLRSRESCDVDGGDLVELDFMPSGPLAIGHSKLFSNRSAHCMASAQTLHGGGEPMTTQFHSRASLRGRTNSCDDQNNNSNNCGQQPAAAAMLNYGGGGGGGNGGAGGGGSSRGTTPRATKGSADALNLNQSSTTVGQPQQQQLPGWPKQQPRLRPSESFIRSIKQQQRELQKSRQQKQQRQQQHSSKNDFPLQEVQCFIAPAERDKIDAMTASRDSLSLRSQRSGSGSCSQQQQQFETIEEVGSSSGGGGGHQLMKGDQLKGGGGASSRPHSRLSQTKPSQSAFPANPAATAQLQQQQQLRSPLLNDDGTSLSATLQQQNEEDDDYVLDGPKTVAVVKA